MKKVGLLLLFYLLSVLPSCANNELALVSNNDISKDIVFVYHIPDEEPSDTDILEEQESQITDITSDDVTADTSGVSEEQDVDADDVSDDTIEEYHLDDLYTDVLKGYAEYNEEEEDAVKLEFLDNNVAKINIKQPATILEKDYTNLKSSSLNLQNKYSKYKAPEYFISPISQEEYEQFGHFRAGAKYGHEIYYAELEQSSGVFSSYDYKNFRISTSYMKTVNTTNNNYNDNFYLAPEWKVNQYFSIKEILSADVTKNRRKTELVLSINPFGKKDVDRFLIELGTSQTYYLDDDTVRNKFKFSTNFKL